MSDRYPISYIDRIRIELDGKGIRTLILVGGCPLRCRYCINPFTWNGKEELEYLTAEELYDRIRIDRLCMLATGGGITFGGGEPLLYPGLIREIRALCDPAVSINVETSLNVPWENVEAVIEHAKLFIVDVKTMDPGLYHEYTGGELAPLIRNLQKLIKRKAPEEIMIRIPSIPGMAGKEDQSESKRKLQAMGFTSFDLFDYVDPEEEQEIE